MERTADGTISSFSPQEQEQINRLQETWCTAGALALSEMLGREVGLSPIGAMMQSAQLLSIPQPVCQTTFLLSLVPGCPLVLILSEQSALSIADLILGGDGASVSASDLHAGAAGEAMRTLVSGIANALTNLRGEPVDTLSIETTFGSLSLPEALRQAPAFIQIPLGLSVFGLFDAEAWMLIAPEFIVPFLSSEPLQSQEAIRMDSDAMSVFGALPEDDARNAQTLQFPSVEGGPSLAGAPRVPSYPAGLNLLLDIPLEVSVELGRVRMLIKDILDLSTGSVVELDKVAGEPVDLLVNGKLVAKGEVVVIEDNFGIRVTEILSPMERLSGLKG